MIWECQSLESGEIDGEWCVPINGVGNKREKKNIDDSPYKESGACKDKTKFPHC